MNEHPLFDFLKAHNIAYTVYKHQPVFTSEELPVIVGADGPTRLPGLPSKNLFLRDANHTFFLVSVAENKRTDLKELNTVLQCGRFSFGKPKDLLALLNLTPGSVTPFGLMFDQENKVTFVLDQDFVTAPFVQFHPLRNDMTITLTPQDFLTCMEKMGHTPQIINIPVK